MQTTSTPPHGEPDHGFTLIELLVVILIVGLLAGIAIPTYLNQKTKAVDASLKADMRQAAMLAQGLLNDPMRIMPATQFNPSGNRVVTYDLMRVRGYDGTTGNSVRIKGEPANGWFILCGFNPSASQATSSSQAMSYDSRTGTFEAGLISCGAATGAWAGDGWFKVDRSEYGLPAPEPWESPWVNIPGSDAR